MDWDIDILTGVQHFESATVRAFWEEIFGRLRGKPVHLLNFEEERARLGLWKEVYIGLQDIPVTAIVGSVGRHQDFTRNFMPRSGGVNKDRWSRIFAETVGKVGLPPVELYKVGEVYYVRDGNHRVSVARDMGTDTVQAYVTELKALENIDD